MKAVLGLALALLIAIATSCSSGDGRADDAAARATEIPAEGVRVPFPPADNLVEHEVLDLEAGSSAAYPQITELDKDPVVLFDEGDRRIVLTDPFLADGRELWELTWQANGKSGVAETDVHEPIAQCAAVQLEPLIGAFAAELVARAVNANPDSPFAPELLVDALLACDGRSEVLGEFPESFDRACLDALTDNDLRALASDDTPAALDALAPCARPFDELPAFISPGGQRCLQDNSERAFRAGDDAQAEILTIFEECLTDAELEQLLAEG